MNKTYGELMAELPKSEELGTYVATAGNLEHGGQIRATLAIRTELSFIGAAGSGDDRFIADLEFVRAYGTPNNIQEAARATAYYRVFHLGEFFERMKRAEAGFEETLATTDRERWPGERHVMRCILNLEDQTAHLYEARRKAKAQRNLHLYGCEDPRAKAENEAWAAANGRS